LQKEAEEKARKEKEAAEQKRKQEEQEAARIKAQVCIDWPFAKSNRS